MRKTIKRAAALAVSASLAGAFPVAQNTFAADENVLNVAISGDPSSLDPALNPLRRGSADRRWSGR